MKQLTKLEIIDETVEYYKTHNRSIINGDCRYNGPNGEKCAFSRCCTNDSEFKEFMSASSQNEAVLLDQYSYIPHTDNFWARVQSLHDVSNNWIEDTDNNTRSLSDKGKQFLEEIK